MSKGEKMATLLASSVLLYKMLCNSFTHKNQYNIIASQDYHCSEEDRHMECEVDPAMTITAVTNATW